MALMEGTSTTERESIGRHITLFEEHGVYKIYIQNQMGDYR